MTLTQIRQLVAINLADDSDIEAGEHRAIENALIDYIEALETSVSKSKVLMLNTFTTDNYYSVPTSLPVGAIISSVVVMLVCKIANFGYGIGDTVTPSAPYPTDPGRTAAQGIGVQYNNSNNSQIRVAVNDQVTIMTSYDYTPGVAAGTVQLSGSLTAFWSVKLIVGYN